MICPICKNNLGDRLTVCPVCGYSVGDEVPAPMPPAPPIPITPVEMKYARDRKFYVTAAFCIANMIFTVFVILGGIIGIKPTVSSVVSLALNIAALYALILFTPGLFREDQNKFKKGGAAMLLTSAAAVIRLFLLIAGSNLLRTILDCLEYIGFFAYQVTLVNIIFTFVQIIGGLYVNYKLLGEIGKEMF